MGIPQRDPPRRAVGNRRAPAIRITQSEPGAWPPWGIDHRRRRGFPKAARGCGAEGKSTRPGLIPAMRIPATARRAAPRIHGDELDIECESANSTGPRWRPRHEGSGHDVNPGIPPALPAVNSPPAVAAVAVWGIHRLRGCGIPTGRWRGRDPGNSPALRLWIPHWPVRRPRFRFSSSNADLNDAPHVRR
jgi:hypothetical protein